jgi:drug/metabolite transporter (DMT)-like permease
VLAAAALWGTSGVFVKLIVVEAEVSALALAFWRDLSTSVLLAFGLAVFRPAWLRAERSQLPWLLGLGASLGIFHVFWNLGVFINGAAVATVQQAAMPAIVTVAAWLIWRESLSLTKILAIILTFVGTVLVSDVGFRTETELSPAGLLVGLAIPVTYAAWNLFGKKVRQTQTALTTLTYAFAFGTLVLLPFQFAAPQPWPLPVEALPWFAALIVCSTILPFTLYTVALGMLPASVATILAMSEIAFVAAYATIFLGENLGLVQVTGAAMVIAAVLYLAWTRRRRESRLSESPADYSPASEPPQ